MTRQETLRIARLAGLADFNRTVHSLEGLQRFADLVVAAERNACAQWMMARGYATGHGDSVADLLSELEWNVRERELKACAQLLIRQMASLRMEAEQGERNERMALPRPWRSGRGVVSSTEEVAMKFRKKPVVIEAVQWFKMGDHPAVVPGFLSGMPVYFIETLEGDHLVTPGDWIITGVKGEHYPCKPDIFEMTYEKAE